MRKNEYYTEALEAAETLPVIDETNGAEQIEYIIKEYDTPMSYDDPIEPEPRWYTYYLAHGKRWKTIKGAQRFIARDLQWYGSNIKNEAKNFRIVAKPAEIY